MAHLWTAYFVAAAIWVVVRYGASAHSAVRSSPRRWLLLVQPLVMLGFAFICGLNVAAIGDWLSPWISRSVTEPLFYIATLIGLHGASFLPLLLGRS